MEDNVLLQLNNISVVYSDVIQVLKGVSLVVKKKQIISLLGSNGAGKTTTLKAISGLLKPENGKVTEGSIEYEGKAIHNSSPETITRLGIIQVLEGRQPFKYLTVEENLRVGTATRWGKPYKKDLELVYHYFQPLVARRNRLAGYCSGGELQMVAIAACLSRRAELYMLDEPSAYLDVEERLNMARTIRRVVENRNVTAFVVEHDVVTQDFIADKLMVFTGKRGMEGVANPPTTLRKGMNKFLKEMQVTFRRDPATKRPRVNKEDSKLDKFQKQIGEYYYQRRLRK